MLKLFLAVLASLAVLFWLAQTLLSQQSQRYSLLFESTNDQDRMKDPYGVAVNSQGQVFVVDAGNHRVLVFDHDGQPQSRWEQRGTGNGEFQSLGFGGIAVDRSDNVFVVDNGNHRIQKFDKDGHFLGDWGKEGRGEGEFIRAIGIATDRFGNVYVTDDANPFVQKFDNNGKFLFRFGGLGTGGGRFSHATGIAVNSDGEIFVADYENRLVQKFSEAGEFATSWKVGLDLDIQGIPEAIAIDEKGHVYVSDYTLGRVQVFDQEGRFLWALGGKSLVDPLFIKPTGLALDGRGRLFVVQQAANKLSAFQVN